MPPEILPCTREPDLERHRTLRKSCKIRTLTVSGWERRQVDRGWQGKSAAFGRAHVVGAVEVLRGIGNDQAIAPFQIVSEINGASAVGLLKFAVRPS
jgi:hypothetical protein